MSATKLQAGFGEAPLNPPAGSTRSSWSTFTVTPVGHAAPLTARATVLQGREERVVVVSIDVCFFEAEFGGTVRRAVAERWKVPVRNVVLQATHSHESFVAETADDDVGQSARRSVLEAVDRAMSDLRPVTVRWGRKRTEGLNVNRRRPGTYVDQDLTLVRFDTKAGPRAVWFHFGAHPLCGMGYDERWSADFPGYASAALSNAHPGLHAQFIQGTAGDAAPLDWWFGNPKPARPTHDETAQEMGRALAAEAESLWHTLKPVRGADRLVVRQRVLQVPLRTFWFSLEEVESLIGELSARVARHPPRPWGDRLHVSTVAQSEPELYMLSGARCVRDLWPGQGKEVPCELQAILLGDDVALMTNPGEIFSSLARDIRVACPVPCPLIASYCNSFLCYIPARHDMEELEGLPFREWIDQPKYRWAYGATMTTRLEKGAGERIVEATLELLQEEKRAAPATERPYRASAP